MQLLLVMLAGMAGLGAGAGATPAAAPSPAHPAAPALERWSQLTEPVFHTLTRLQGLPNEVVYSVAQDAQGYLWIGTVGGLMRWDGYQARPYRAGPPSAGRLPDGWIQVLHRDGTGRLWVGTSGGGVARHDPQTDRFESVGAGPQGLSHVNVHTLADDGRGGLWVGSDGGLDRLDLRTLQVTDRAGSGALLRGLPRGRVQALLRDRDSRLWVGGEAGLFRHGPEGFERVAFGGSATGPASPVRVQSLMQDQLGRLWVGTQRHGTWLWLPDAPRRPLQPLRLDRPGVPAPDQAVTGLHELRPGVVWITTLGQGVTEVHSGPGDPAAWPARRFRHTPGLAASLPSNTVRGVYRDRSGLLWLATDRGISHHDPGQTGVLTMFGHGLALAGPQAPAAMELEVSWVLPADDGRQWLGTHQHGVLIVDPSGHQPPQTLRPDPARPLTALPEDIVLGMTEGPAREKYIGTKRGLYRASADGRRVERLALAGRDPEAGTWALWCEGATLWIGGGTDGLWSLDLASGQAQRRSRPRDAAPDAPGLPGPEWQLSEDRVTLLAPAGDGTLWVGTRHGLNQVHPERGVLARHLPDRDNPQALAGGFVTAAHTDRRGRLWLGTFGAGLGLVEQPAQQPLRVRRLGTADGLPDDNVNAVLEDAQGRLWVSTDSGLAVIDPASLQVRTLHRADGVVFPNYWTGAAAATAQGELLFGGSGGMTVVRPEAVAEWAFSPPLVLTALQLGGRAQPVAQLQALQSGQALRVEPGANSLTLEFAALDYSDPARLRYAALLQGVDDDWVELDAQHRLVAHANLDPGDYTLLLRATNRQGLWGPRPLRVALQVLPAWYQTWWARAAGALAALLAVALLLQWRTRRLRQQQALLEARVEERTAQLREVSQRLAEKSLALERKSLALEQASLTDPLTGLHNRRYLSGRLANPAAADAGYALLLIDIDHFKQINDRHGHASGDAALVAVAQRLTQQLRPGDHLVRWGGEEFLLVAHGAGPAPAAALAERLRQALAGTPLALAAPASEAAGRLAVTVSIGFACLPFLPAPDAAPAGTVGGAPAGGASGTPAAPAAAEALAAPAALPAHAAADAALARARAVPAAGPLSPRRGQPLRRAAPAASGGPAIDWEEALSVADLALYAAKRNGRNTWIGLAAGPAARPQGLVARLLAQPQAAVAQQELRLLCPGDPAAALAALRSP